MTSKQVGWPFQEGYIAHLDGETHIFTDYRWNDGSVTRRWIIDPESFDLDEVMTRPFDFGFDQ